jgi:hypothetical protein
MRGTCHVSLEKDIVYSEKFPEWFWRGRAMGLLCVPCSNSLTKARVTLPDLEPARKTASKSRNDPYVRSSYFNSDPIALNRTHVKASPTVARDMAFPLALVGLSDISWALSARNPGKGRAYSRRRIYTRPLNHNKDHEGVADARAIASDFCHSSSSAPRIFLWDLFFGSPQNFSRSRSDSMAPELWIWSCYSHPSTWRKKNQFCCCASQECSPRPWMEYGYEHGLKSFLSHFATRCVQFVTILKPISLLRSSASHFWVELKTWNHANSDIRCIQITFCRVSVALYRWNYQ